MEFAPFLPLFSVLVLVLAGVGSLALSLTVWRRRRVALRGQEGARRSLSQGLLLVGFLGSVAILISLTVRSFFPRRGELRLHDVVVVRADPSRGLPVLERDPERPAGAAILRFERPGDAEESVALEHQIARLAAQRRALEEAPLEVDPDLVHRQQEWDAERRFLSARRTSLEIELQRLRQTTRNEILEREVQRGQLRTELGEFEARIAKLDAELEYARLRKESGQNMLSESVISSLQQAAEERSTAVLSAERRRLEDERAGQRALLTELEVGIAELRAALEAHETHVGSALAELARAEQRSAADAERLRRRQSEEVDRQQRVRAAGLRALELEAEETQARQRALLQRGTVPAPAAGRVLWRHAAPAGAAGGDPIVLFGPEDAARARFRLRRSEAEALLAAGDVELIAPAEELLEPRLRGRCTGFEAIEHEPQMVLAELVCSASGSQLRYLARGHELAVRLDWAPPIWHDVLLRTGLALLALSLLCQLAFGRTRQTRERPVVVARARLRDVEPERPQHERDEVLCR